MPETHDITQLLDRLRSGDRDAEEKLYEIVMPHLRRLAQSMLSHERPNHTLQATELVNRMYVRLAGHEFSLRDRSHFFAIAARAMRRELIDYARARPHITVLPLDGLPDFLASAPGNQELALVVDELLEQLRETMPLECSIVELKLFFGMTDEETADAINLPLRSMQARWQDARIWLFERAEAQGWQPTRQTRNR